MAKEIDLTESTDRREQHVENPDTRRARWSNHDVVEALSFATTHFEAFISEVNALNVFPVPDGDTGTNMFLTLKAAMNAARQSMVADGKSVGDVLQAAAQGSLMGARGNSGVILYQMIQGLAESAPGTDEIDGAGLAVGLRRAADLAYQAVINPVEGTILTVMRVAADASEQAAESDPSVEHVLSSALRSARHALARTPEQLPVLRRAGVVDAGGKGLVVILDGLMRFTNGQKPAHVGGQHPQDVATAMAFLDQVELVHGVDEFGYCTNFLLTSAHLDVDHFRQRMNELGKSAVVVGSEIAVKVHVHTEHPGALLEAALEYGELEDVRIDNMAAQTRKLLADRSLHEQTVAAQVERVPIAVVAVASGAGLAEALTGMGANVVIDGGPTTNPSTQEILTAVERAPSDVVIVLPNDPNVIPSARQVTKLTDKTVCVVPSKSVPQGITALSSFNMALEVDDNVAAMTDSLQYVTTLAIARASRDADIDDISARKGEYIGLVDGKMVAAGPEIIPVILAALATTDALDAELLTIFTGADADQSIVETLTDDISRTYPDLTVEVARGDQPHYELVLAVE